jgi:hypothetical protein
MDEPCSAQHVIYPIIKVAMSNSPVPADPNTFSFRELLLQANIEGIGIAEDRLKSLVKNRVILPILRRRGRSGSRFSADALARLRLLHEKGLEVRGEIPDIRWALWLAGYFDQWSFVKEILLANLLMLSNMLQEISAAKLAGQIQDFSWLRSRLAQRRDPFLGIQKMLGVNHDQFNQMFESFLSYLIQPYLYQSPYSFEHETSQLARDFETGVGGKVFELHENLAAAGHANLDFLRSNLENLKDSDVMTLAEYFRRADDKQEYQEIMTGFETISSSTNKKPHYVSAKWISRAMQVCLLASNITLGHVQE